MMTILTMNSMLLSIMFLSMNHPMSLGFILLLQTIMISIISSFLSYSFWFSYILFLIMIGGMLILFTYITSMAANETFKMSKKEMFIILLFIMPLLIMLIYKDKNLLTPSIKLIDSINSSSKMEMIQMNNLMLNKIYNKPNNLMSLILINYLFLTLIMVVKITNYKSGPLRQKF
uniref:NADH-ubiquinone oxidoreductase chain 6 n=1 Tax=Scirtes sp. 2 ACP-2013 TaxID=1434573 RepID=A0A3G4RYN2_9COLE|nr:NADH dehydrogenase subunit 6 [Scirtes sp. 2 ACP-2013]